MAGEKTKEADVESNKSDIFQDQNVKNFVLYKTFIEPLFWGAVLISYCQVIAGMDLPQVFLMESVACGLVASLDVVAGALADVIGRRKTVVLGSFLRGFDVLIFAIATCPWMAWAADFVWAVGFSLMSGADSALLYDYLKEIGREDEYLKIQGKGESQRLILTAFGSILAGILADINMRLTAMVSIPGVFFACYAISRFKESRPSQKFSVKSQIDVIKGGLSHVWRSSKICWLIIFFALLSVVSKIWFFSYNPYFELAHLSYTEFGVIFFLLNIVAWFSSSHVADIKKFFGRFGTLALMLNAIAIPITIMGFFVCRASSYLVMFQNISRGMLNPVIGEMVNEEASSEIRATVLSAKSSFSNIINLVLFPMFGYATAAFGLAVCLQFVGICTFVFGLLALCVYKQVFSHKS
ncbi:MAG: MFS transporter [Candidatus Paceibacterota bacterium]|jgi:MFS family permease